MKPAIGHLKGHIKGQIGLNILVPIALAGVGILVGNIGYTNSKTDQVNERVSVVREDVARLQASLDAIKGDTDKINDRLDALLIKQGINPDKI